MRLQNVTGIPITSDTVPPANADSKLRSANICHKQCCCRHLQSDYTGNMIADTSPEKRAPEPLHVVQRFVNSADLETGEEDLATPGALRDWLAERGLMDAQEPVTEGDLRRAIDVREGLRALLLANNGLTLDSAALERLNRAASRAGMRLRYDPEGGATLEPDATGVDGALARLMAVVAEATADGTWERLKACPKEDCNWAFYDRSKNRSGRWCKMEVCGNVEKARAYRQRHRGDVAKA
jgi:predicted RNA-binding Zn ribbon-like protein